MVGMGGAGMSAIARVLIQAGLTVTGSDVRESAVLEGLRALGVRADVGHRARQAEGADVLIITNAVAPGNVEVEFARAAGIPVLWRGEALAQIVGSLRTVAVSGTHGKTTTSGMVATILEAAGERPTYLMGSDLAGRGSRGPPRRGRGGGRRGGRGLPFLFLAQAFDRRGHQYRPGPRRPLRQLGGPAGGVFQLHGRLDRGGDRLRRQPAGHAGGGIAGHLYLRFCRRCQRARRRAGVRSRRVGFSAVRRRGRSG